MLKSATMWSMALGCVVALGSAGDALAGVDVDIDGNIAHALISLDDGIGNTFGAEVTITFDTPVNLSAKTLNLTADLIGPSDPAITSRLPPGEAVLSDFPMMVTVEPPQRDCVFCTEFEGVEDGSGILRFKNEYEIEIHTHDLPFTTDTALRLLKAPLAGNFVNYTSDILPGSVRMRGRDGAFSQFLVGTEGQCSQWLVPLLLEAIAQRLVLLTRLLASAIDDVLRLDLIGLLDDVLTDLVAILLDVTGAIANLDEFIFKVQANAGTGIPNAWDAEHTQPNDTGELLGLAQALRYTLVRLQSAPLLCL